MRNEEAGVSDAELTIIPNETNQDYEGSHLPHDRMSCFGLLMKPET